MRAAERRRLKELRGTAPGAQTISFYTNQRGGCFAAVPPDVRKGSALSCDALQIFLGLRPGAGRSPDQQEVPLTVSQ
ncbi:MAG: hypothetical protein ACRD9R_17965, partial [Pyrinomonadaceae bacterium]